MSDDKELDAALSEIMPETGGEPSSDGQTSSPAGTASSQGSVGDVQWPVNVAGRTYQNANDLIKSHDQAVRLNSRIKNEYSELQKWSDPWKKYEKALNSDPEYRKAMEAAEGQYLAARQGGASQASARAEAKDKTGVQLPKEIVEKLERHDKFISQQQSERDEARLESEIKGIREQYKADDALVDKVLGVMYDVAKRTGLEISADDAYWRVMAQTHREQLAVKDKELSRVRADASVGPSTGQNVRSGGKSLDKMTDQEFLAAMASDLDSKGMRD